MQPHETAEYNAAARPLRDELVELARELAQMRREGNASVAEQNALIKRMRRVREELEQVPPSRRAAPVLAAACEPAVVRDVFLGLWSGITVSLAAACSSAARTIGVGCSLGEVVSQAATALLAKAEPALRRQPAWQLQPRPLRAPPTARPSLSPSALARGTERGAGSRQLCQALPGCARPLLSLRSCRCGAGSSRLFRRRP